MRQKLLVIAIICLACSALPLQAATVTFFGEDVNTAGGSSITPTLANSNAAQALFFANLTGVGTETFEEFSQYTYLPITVTFAGAGDATLTDPTGTSFIESGNDGAGRFPISGTQYLETGAGSGFTISFSSPISAFGFYGTDVGDFGGALALDMTKSGGGTVLLPVGNTIGSNGSTSGSALYFGFYDLTNTYTSITFDNTGSGGVDVFGFDNFSIGSLQQVTPTPEPGTLAFLGMGLLGLIIRRGRKS
ncbi:MAG TPA: PEP-CTERM sorting domain-containing protein [Terriglobia bacterium]|nr:PEP-CTERM sorting domain-containing protein [Terriglobia bacterium]